MNLCDQISHDLWEEDEDVYPMMIVMHKITFIQCLATAFSAGVLTVPLISWIVK